MTYDLSEFIGCVGEYNPDEGCDPPFCLMCGNEPCTCPPEDESNVIKKRTKTMKTFTFPEINDAENGQQIPSFTGTIKKVFDQKSGIGDYGEWHLQNIILTDEHGNEITVTWTSDDPWTVKDQGKRLVFESGYDKKEQLCGIKKEIKNKNGKRYESVKVDDRAKVKDVAPSDKPSEPPQTDPDWLEATQDTPESPVQPQNGNGVMEARKHIMRSANLYVLCVNAVNKYVAAHFPEVAQTSEMFQAATGTLFIEASSRRTTDGVNWWSYVDKMPESPIQ